MYDRVLKLIITFEFFKFDFGIRLLNFSYPAVSHKFKVITLSSIYIFYVIKSIPMVAW